MPTYQYACKQCGHHFELFQRFSDEPVTRCPQCAGAVFRVIHPVGVIFKGPGFYVTDNGRGSNGTLKNSPKANGETPTNGKEEKKESAQLEGDKAAASSKNK